MLTYLKKKWLTELKGHLQSWKGGIWPYKNYYFKVYKIIYIFLLLNKSVYVMIKMKKG
jgi:hypothetical protein